VLLGVAEDVDAAVGDVDAEDDPAVEHPARVRTANKENGLLTRRATARIITHRCLGLFNDPIVAVRLGRTSGPL
jgi:hypothetical protein